MKTTESSQTKLYPLTPAQHLLFYALKFTLHKEFINIPISIEIDSDIDLDRLKQAVLEAISRNDSFGIRFVKEGKEWRQYFSERQAVSLELFDFRGQSDEKLESRIHKLASTPMHINETPMNPVLIYRNHDGKAGVFAVFNHLTMDFWAISLFFKDVMAIYFALSGQGEMPPSIRDFETTLQKDLEYISSQRYLDDKAFWAKELDQHSEKCFYTHVNGSEMLEKVRQKKKDPTYRFYKNLYLNTKADHEVLTIDKAVVEKAKDFCEKNGLPAMSMVFYMGFRTYFSKVNNRASTIGSLNVVARRSTLDEKKSGGTRAQAIPFSLDLDESLTFKEAIEALVDKQNLLYRHADISPEDVLHLEKQVAGIKPTETWRCMAYTFQPIPIDVGHGVKITSKWHTNGSSPQPLYITVMDGDGTGDLRVYYEYIVKQIKPERLREFHDYAIKVVEAGVTNPAITVKELMEL